MDYHEHFALPTSGAAKNLPPPRLAAENIRILSIPSIFTRSFLPEMAASTQNVLEGIERRRIELQANVDKLQRALSQWTTWEAEYRALKAELQHAHDPSPKQMRDIARNLGGFLLNEKEFEELLGKDSKTKRSANQVIDVISRRIDYVQQNSATIEKQLDSAEKQLAGVDILLEPGMHNEEGLPMMDIEEELDDAGNEVSSSINQTGKGAAEVVEALRKAGLKKAELEKLPSVSEKEEPFRSSEARNNLSSIKEPPNSTSVHSGSTTSRSDSPSKRVSFAGGEPKRTKLSDAKEALQQNGYDEDLDTLNFNSGTKVIQLDDNDDMVASYPVIPQGESPEDAELRRQMLQYGLSEVGKVVAELDLDRPTASYPEDDFDEDSDFNDYGTETDDDEEEDEYGRTTKPVVTEEYRRQMLELEKKLSARMLENVGPTPENQPLAEHTSDFRTMRVRKDDEFDQSLSVAESGATQAATGESPKRKKGVRFAASLDISDALQPTPKSVIEEETARPTISDTIVERPLSQSESAAQRPKPAKVSRFKSARAGLNAPPKILPMPAVVQTPAIPTGPAGRTLASTITEHLPGPAEPRAPEEFDRVLIQREVQTEYHKMRNRFIQQQGGFKATEEDEERPIVKERDGKTKKVSRFMTARLKAEGM